MEAPRVGTEAVLRPRRAPHRGDGAQAKAETGGLVVLPGVPSRDVGRVSAPSRVEPEADAAKGGGAKADPFVDRDGVTVRRRARTRDPALDGRAHGRVRCDVVGEHLIHVVEREPAL